MKQHSNNPGSTLEKVEQKSEGKKKSEEQKSDEMTKVKGPCLEISTVQQKYNVSHIYNLKVSRGHASKTEKKQGDEYYILFNPIDLKDHFIM